MRTPIIIDTDPGQDDAVALLLALAAHDELDILAVTTVAGNVPLAQTTANALRILDLAGRADVPVHAGAERPLLFDLETAEFVCGPDGLAGSDLPSARRSATDGHAVDVMIRLLRERPPGTVTMCGLGPLTNLALALRLAPDIANRIGRIVLMGGAMNLGNITPAAEFNTFVDPHAAAIVLGADIPITMLGLHATHQAVCPPDALDRLAGLGTRAGRAIVGMLTRPRPNGLGTAGHPMHDPCVIAILLGPGLFDGRDCFVDVETGPGPLRGRTTIDWNGRLRHPPNARVIDTLNTPILFRRMVDVLSRLP